MPLNVYISGDKDGFNSKMAVDKFKSAVKSSSDVDIDLLKTKYIKTDYTLELESKNDTDIKFNIMKKESLKESIITEPKQVLRAKLKMMRQNRSNTEVTAAKNNKDVPEDILNEYIKLKKVAGGMPIPEPCEILAKPEEYKPLITMVLGNDMIKQKGSNHPYVRYFKLLADKLGVSAPEITPMQDYTELLNNKVKDDVSLTNVKGNNMVSADYETDSETDSESNN